MEATVLKSNIFGPLIELFVVYNVVDEWGRAGRVTGIYSTKALAEAAAHKKGFYGSNDEVVKQNGIVLQDGRILVIQPHTPDVLDVSADELKARRRAEALAKLNDGDLEALGLSRGVR